MKILHIIYFRTQSQAAIYTYVKNKLPNNYTIQSASDMVGLLPDASWLRRLVFNPGLNPTHVGNAVLNFTRA